MMVITETRIGIPMVIVMPISVKVATEMMSIGVKQIIGIIHYNIDRYDENSR